jgi:DNA-binding transcriptional MerR regulator
MAPERPHRPAGTVATVLANLRRAPKQIRRQGRDVIETAVSQLFDAVIRQAYVANPSGEYRIDDLAHLAGTTTRNVRVYRDRGLLPAPLRVGRIALYNDTHLTRLRLIASMLDRGYTIANVHEMLSAWEQGKNLGDVLGLETALVGSWATEKPEAMPTLDAERLIADPKAFARLVALQLIRTDGAEATLLRPQLVRAFTTIRDNGISIDKLIDVHEQIVPHIDQISAILVRTGAEHVATYLTPGEALPEDPEVAELITLLISLRTQAVASVTATLTASIEATIESMVGGMLTKFIDHTTGSPSNQD